MNEHSTTAAAGALLLTLTLLITLVGCSGGSGSADKTTTTVDRANGTPLTQVQATTLAEVLYRDYQAGGSSFEVDLPADGEIVAKLSGDVDWVGGVASADYETTAGSGIETPYVWNPSIVLDGGINGLEQAMAAQGRSGVTWISRPLDPKTIPLDGIFALLLTLASNRPGNPQLIAEADTGYMGSTTVDGVAVEELRYGDVTYYVGLADQLPHEVVAHYRTYSDPVVIRLSHFGARTVQSPQRNAVVDASTIPAIYQRLTGRAAPKAATPPPSAPTSTTTP